MVDMRPFASARSSAGTTVCSSALSGRTGHRGGQAVAEHDQIDQPHLAGIVDQQQEQDQDRGGEVRDDQHRTAAQPVGQHSADRADQAAQREHEEGQGRRRRTPRQHPDLKAHGEPECEVADGGQELPGYEEPGVPLRVEAPHAGSSSDFAAPTG